MDAQYLGPNRIGKLEDHYDLMFSCTAQEHRFRAGIPMMLLLVLNFTVSG